MKKGFKPKIIKEWHLPILAGAISALLIVGGYLFYSSEEKSIRKEKHLEIQAVAELKISQILQWRKERELLESENRFHSAFENAAAGMTLTATDGKLLQVNKSFCRMLGYSESELLNLTFNEITHPDDSLNRPCVLLLFVHLWGDSESFRDRLTKMRKVT